VPEESLPAGVAKAFDDVADPAFGSEGVRHSAAEARFS
jgi:hypothetical protein